jgi:multidrug efflux pump
MVQFNLTASTNCIRAAVPRPVVKQVNGGIIRLSDVANVTLGADDYESGVVQRQAGRLSRHPDVPSASLLR